MDSKKQFFEDLIDLLKKNNAVMVVKIDGKNNSYIGFNFEDSTYCCNSIEEIDPNKKIVFECEEKFVIEKNSVKDFPVKLDDHFTFNK